MNERPKRVCIYTRVSTDDQTTTGQLQALQRYCLDRGWTVSAVFDDVISGSTISRPGLDKMMGLIRKRRYDCLLVWAIDRLARSAIHAILTMNELTTLGVNFVSYTQGLDTTTPIGKAMFSMAAVFAELELDGIRERVRAGVARARTCSHCRHAEHHAKCPACPCASYESQKLFGRAGWTSRPGAIPREAQAQILSLKGTASQRKIAAQVGVSQATVMRVLNHKGGPKVAFSTDGDRVAFQTESQV